MIKMKKQTLAFILGIFLLTSVIAGGVLTSLSLDSKAVATLKAELPIDKIADINPTYTDIVCDKVVCKSWITYDNLINTEWIQKKDYCSKRSPIIKNTRNQTIGGNECIEYLDYTKVELEDLRKAWIEKRLEDFAGYLDEKNDKEVKE